MKNIPIQVVVLISGSGSNLQALIDGTQADLPIQIRAVISNEPDAFGLERAHRAGIETRVLNHRDYPSRKDYDDALGALIDKFEPGLIVLAGFMRILTREFVDRFRGRMLNIHPSLLPKFRGLHTHQRALEAGETVHGASVHFVTEALDGGPVVLQARVPVEPGDDPEKLAARVLSQEHRIYPQTVRWFAEGWLQVDEDDRLWFGRQLLSQPLRLDAAGRPRLDGRALPPPNDDPADPLPSWSSVPVSQPAAVATSHS
ncbi:phosphoribosylglycinamide formyltransferase [Candidatus Thiosymbion oneisti]|uniref:phosphoribosylglycinamide formyltransferase n=1 Tax=Candidatus Thiosymbion oneisti TaxID=589554 RepID=UPI000A9214C5|nr:phosphoribosylglycinamide formyltransferase [Candidatus Thiosymbion oneisti]